MKTWINWKQEVFNTGLVPVSCTLPSWETSWRTIKWEKEITYEDRI